ncbi:MAG: LysM peptidoglycan-binding domain-containing protein [Thermoflexibacter sp.]|jgi:LysM repeat protein|nr:LysM peptidoglycan-binding domain-containing protein [Thermoflexibacter sp.]
MKTLLLPFFIVFCIQTTTIAQSQEPTPKPADSTNVGAKDTIIISTHTVSYGETLYAIAKKYNVSANDLLLWNNLSKSTILDKGQKLIVVPPPTATNATNLVSAEQKANITKIPEDKIHIVSYGEYPYLIAKKYGISPNNLLIWNNLDENSKLDYGDRLWLVNPTQSPSTEESAEKGKRSIPEDFKHTVQYGENLYFIAQTYNIPINDLLKWNNLTIGSRIDKGNILWLKSPNE